MPILFNYSDIFTIYFLDVETVCEHKASTHSLVYIYSGEMHLMEKGKEVIIPAGQCVFIRRDHLVTFTKLSVYGQQFKGITMHFRRDFLRQFYRKMDSTNFPVIKESLESSVVPIHKNPAFDSLFVSLIPYFDTKEKPSEELVILKMQEGVINLLQLDKRFFSTFFDFTEPWKIDILDFLNENYMYELTMDEIATYTGRSLATFKRDFKKISTLTPQKWLIQKRLQVAYDMIKEKGMKVMDVCYDVGFKNRTHFTNAFKKRYGYAPTQTVFNT